MTPATKTALVKRTEKFIKKYSKEYLLKKGVRYLFLSL
jgi:hypothetical protein